jgi:DNA-binding protein HU-beta
MNKAELIERVAKEMDSTKAECERYLTAYLGGITAGLKKDKTVQLVGFGTFTVKKRKARKGRNPQTKEEIRIPASKTVSFKVGKTLKDSV